MQLKPSKLGNTSSKLIYRKESLKFERMYCSIQDNVAQTTKIECTIFAMSIHTISEAVIGPSSIQFRLDSSVQHLKQLACITKHAQTEILKVVKMKNFSRKKFDFFFLFYLFFLFYFFFIYFLHRLWVPRRF